VPRSHRAYWRSRFAACDRVSDPRQPGPHRPLRRGDKKRPQTLHLDRRAQQIIAAVGGVQGVRFHPLGRGCGVNNGSNCKPSSRYRPSGVRTPNQLSRTC
jgi:hypothetical protein